MAEVKGKFSIAIDGTADLTPPSLECSWEVEYKGDADFEVVLIAYFKSHYEKKLRALLEAQLGKLSAPLRSMQAEIDDMTRLSTEIANATELAHASALMASYKQKFGTVDVNHQVAEYNAYVLATVENVKKQQLLQFKQKIEEEAFAEAVKKVRRDIRDRSVRHVTGVTVRGALALGTAAAGAASIIITFGTAQVAFAAISAVAAPLSTTGALVSLFKDVLSLKDEEGRAMTQLAADVAGIVGKLDGVEVRVAGLGKHVMDVSTHYSARLQKSKELADQMAACEAALAEVIDKSAGLRASAPKVYAAAQKELKPALGALLSAKTAWRTSLKRDEQLKDVLTAANNVLGGLDKIPFQGAASLASVLKQIDFKDPVTYAALAESLGNVMNAVGAVGMAKTPK